MPKRDEQFERFLFEMDDALAELLAYVDRLDDGELRPLDYSFESLDRLEKLFRRYLEGVLAPGVSDEIFRTRVARYVGETVRRRIGGTWAVDRNKRSITVDLPGIKDLPGCHRSYIWCPHAVLANLAHNRVGLLRSASEVHLRYVR
jgi:hypothetical protein